MLMFSNTFLFHKKAGKDMRPVKIQGNTETGHWKATGHPPTKEIPSLIAKPRKNYKMGHVKGGVHKLLSCVREK